MKKYLVFCIIALFLASCASKKDNELFNLSPEAWYEQIIKDIKDQDLEAASNHYTSFSSEHIKAPLLEPCLLILADAFTANGDSSKAVFYLDEFIKRYGDTKNTEFARFLKIRLQFYAVDMPNRDDNLIKNNVLSASKFLQDYPDSIYKPLVETMLVKLVLSEYNLDKSIYELYNRTSNTISAEIYKEKLENSPLKNYKIIKPKMPWYAKPFN